MFNIVLYEPEIPPNTGNIIRLCVNTSSNLHLIKPLGFNLDEKQVRRAGLDYHDVAKINIYETYSDCLKTLKGNRFFAVTTKATKYYGDFDYKKGDVFVFGPETRGLPMSILDNLIEDEKIRVPMVKNNRSLNLSNSVAIVLYEAWRQINFESGI
ncbi:tRNA (uridine(34)/cytosine(34)/5-carboxymethylaminomethyluridine(34)-2'-O)-methyltransferase TrmL [Methylophilaceae bacterium]|nr:tRNA (uridine(34)/cytosine(34)/5-carboxymethylaminomethyluridine(34)-2'-O)-methyltransferase TrmL [Methylophilaceae bacterium]|tara:strand:+ start:47 stop:511 length:465 start_codon:yes stop_codon:yes gene_type:complete